MKLIDRSTDNIFIFFKPVKSIGLFFLVFLLEQYRYELYLSEHLKHVLLGKKYTMCVGNSVICRITGTASIVLIQI